MFFMEKSLKVLNLNTDNKGDTVLLPLPEMSPPLLISPGTEQTHMKEAGFCRETFPSLLEGGEIPLTPSCHNTKQKGFSSLHTSTTPHTSAEHHFAEVIHKWFKPGVELTLCRHKCYDKLQRVHRGQKAEYHDRNSPVSTIVYCFSFIFISNTHLR